jgi:hypothetical protein
VDHGALLKRLLVLKSFGAYFISCEVIVREHLSLLVGHSGLEYPMDFFRRYTEVAPHSSSSERMTKVATGAVATVTFEERGAQTLPTAPRWR